MDFQKLKQIAINRITDSAVNYISGYIRKVPGMITDKIKEKMMFTMNINESSEIYDAFQDWYYKNYEDAFRNVTVYNFARSADGNDAKAQRKQKELEARGYGSPSNADFGFGVGYQQETGGSIIEYDGAKIKVTKNRVAADNDSKRTIQCYTLTGTSKEKMKALVEDIYGKYNSDHDQIKVLVNDYYGEWRMVKRVKGKTLDNIVLPAELHKRLTEDIVEFEGDKEWYDKLNIPYKRGYLLHGPPGNGKTSLSIAIANKHKRNIYCLDLAKLRDDGSLRQAFNNLTTNSLLLIEDIDATFKSRALDEKTDAKKAKNPFASMSGPQVSFACLLNCLDGVYYKDGLITIMTTNYLERLDSALIRPGRIDMKVLVTNPGQAEVDDYFTRFYGSPMHIPDYIPNLPMAEIQGICITNKKDPDAAILELATAMQKEYVYDVHSTGGIVLDDEAAAAMVDMEPDEEDMDRMKDDDQPKAGSPEQISKIVALALAEIQKTNPTATPAMLEALVDDMADSHEDLDLTVVELDQVKSTTKDDLV